MKHVLKAGQFDKAELQEILRLAGEMEEALKKGGTEIAKGKILGTIFYEPSTRTRLSFETAMHRLGGSVITEANVHFSSRSKGEVLPDTIRIIGGFADVIAIRSQQKGDAEVAAEYSPIPIINAGDGPGEHPTQSLLDLYTISKRFKVGEAPLKVAFVGDLKYGRTVHSLTTILRNFDGVEISFVAPEVIQMPESYLTPADKIYTELTDEVLSSADVVYDTRIQQERFEDKTEYERLKGTYIFTPELVSKTKDNAMLLHPLPRVNEIELEVDKLPQAMYFAQARNGVPVRMALIARALDLA